MTKDQCDFLREVCEDAGMECDVRSDYSDRYMYGKSTYGIVIGSTEDLLVATITYMKQQNENVLDCIPDFTSFKTDSMGRDMILY